MPVKLRGALLVGQSGGPTPVINASLVGTMQEAFGHDDITAIYGMRHGVQGALAGDLVDLGQESAATFDALLRTPGSALGSCRYKVKAEDYERLLEVFRRHGIRYFVYIGGNDSMDTAHRVSLLASELGHEVRVMGVPKTIDNDLERTDHSPGYGSAARFVALATMDAGRDLESMNTFDKVTVFDVMGRDSGFLTAATALGKRCPQDPPHLICLPERPFDERAFLERVTELQKELGHVFVAA